MMLGFKGFGMRRSRSPASSCCIAFGRDSSDWDVSAFKIELHLQSGTRCFGPEFRAATQRLSARVGYLHQSRVEHAIGVIKRVFGFAKLRYRGLNKNLHRLLVTCALANLFMVRRHLLRGQGA